MNLGGETRSREASQEAIALIKVTGGGSLDSGAIAELEKRRQILKACWKENK